MQLHPDLPTPKTANIFLTTELFHLVQEPKAEKGPASFTESGSAGSDNAAAAGAAQPQPAAAIEQ